MGHSKKLWDEQRQIELVVAICQNPNPLLPNAIVDLTVSELGTIMVDEYVGASKKGVFAKGDVAIGMQP